jgi:hypothetical protein
MWQLFAGMTAINAIGGYQLEKSSAKINKINAEMEAASTSAAYYSQALDYDLQKRAYEINAEQITTAAIMDEKARLKELRSTLASQQVVTAAQGRAIESISHIRMDTIQETERNIADTYRQAKINKLSASMQASQAGLQGLRATAGGQMATQMGQYQGQQAMAAGNIRATNSLLKGITDVGMAYGGSLGGSSKKKVATRAEMNSPDYGWGG